MRAASSVIRTWRDFEPAREQRSELRWVEDQADYEGARPAGTLLTNLWASGSGVEEVEESR